MYFSLFVPASSSSLFLFSTQSMENQYVLWVIGAVSMCFIALGLWILVLDNFPIITESNSNILLAQFVCTLVTALHDYTLGNEFTLLEYYRGVLSFFIFFLFP